MVEHTVHIRGVIGPSPIPPTCKFAAVVAIFQRRGFFFQTILHRSSCKAGEFVLFPSDAAGKTNVYNQSVWVEDSPFNLSSRVSRQVDGALVNLRWMLIALVWVIETLITGNPIPDDFFLVWLVTYAAFNGLLSIGVRYKQLPQHLPTLGLIGDMLAFSILPLLPGVNNPLLVLFAIYPTLVAAMRFGIAVGALVAALVLLPYEAAAILLLLPAPLRDILPISFNTDISIFSAFLPLLALLGSVFLVGYLAQREREAAIGRAQVELEELRKAMENARLLYDTSDSLSGSTDYVHVLESMLQAGVSGMPRGRMDTGAPVGIALIFRDALPGEDHKSLAVAASRGLDRADTGRAISGKQGIVAKVLESGDAIPFGKVGNDPELSQFSTLQRARTGVCYPLQSGLDVYGVVILATPSTQMPNEQHLRLMRAFINQAAIAFQNATLYQNLREERDRIIEAEALARAKLARDLHDGPTQSMAALAMRLDFIRLLMDRDPPQAKQELEQAREAVMRVGKELRGLLFTLRPLTLETQGLSAALKQYEQRLRENEGIPIDVQAGNFGIELDVNVSATVFAIIEEAVNNARKHGGGAPIHVNVQQQGGSLVATVRDEGPGFDTDAVSSNYSERGSLGMVNMRDRARLVDGKFSLESAPGRGTRVTLTVPLNDRRRARADAARK